MRHGRYVAEAADAANAANAADAADTVALHPQAALEDFSAWFSAFDPEGAIAIVPAAPPAQLAIPGLVGDAALTAALATLDPPADFIDDAALAAALALDTPGTAGFIDYAALAFDPPTAVNPFVSGSAGAGSGRRYESLTPCLPVQDAMTPISAMLRQWEEEDTAVCCCALLPAPLRPAAPRCALLPAQLMFLPRRRSLVQPPIDLTVPDAMSLAYILGIPHAAVRVCDQPPPQPSTRALDKR